VTIAREGAAKAAPFAWGCANKYMLAKAGISTRQAARSCPPATFSLEITPVSKKKCRNFLHVRPKEFLNPLKFNNK
jgi:hypothetical protein